MRAPSGITFGFGRQLPLLLQTETTECGLACIGMVAGYYGSRTDMSALRARFSISLRGAGLAQLLQVAAEMELNSRPLSVQLDEISKLATPCLLHWQFDHFVVLKRASRKYVVVFDPAVGIRRLSISELSGVFTGVAVELWPAPGFKPKEDRQRLRLRTLIGKTRGVVPILAQIMVLALAMEVCGLVFPFFTQWVVDDVIVSSDRDLLTTLAIGFGMLLLFQQATAAVRGWIVMYLDTNVGLQWRGNVFAHLTRLPLDFFLRRHLGDIVSRFSAIDQIQKTVTTSFVTAILDGLMSIITLIMMFIYSWLLALIGLGALMLYVLVRWARYGALRTATESQIAANARQQSHFLESIRGIKAIKLFRREEDRKAKWMGLVVREINATIRTQQAQLLYETARGVLSGIERILVLWLGARMVMDGGFTVGALMAFVSYKDQFDSRITSLTDKLFEVRMLQLQGQRLSDIVLTRPEIVRGHVDWTDENDRVPTIELRNVWFRYSQYEPYVLKNLSVTIPAGQAVAITGPSGGGKTTLLHLILGIHTPQKGQILIAGMGARKVGIDTIRGLVGTVTQDDVLFAGSIADNISFFDPRADLEWLQECARLAVIHDEILAMPMKYRTLVGDMGTVLSGGQKQRVLLARALYKKPKVLIMDEATSHLDSSLESLFVASVRSLKITRIIVAHRRETIASADRVVVLKGGSLDECAPAMKPGR